MEELGAEEDAEEGAVFDVVAPCELVWTAEVCVCVLDEVPFTEAPVCEALGPVGTVAGDGGTSVLVSRSARGST